MAHDGFCKNYAPKKHQLGTLRYKDGQSYCKACERWMIWDGGTIYGKDQEVTRSKLYCPCCNHRLRLHSRKTTLNTKECAKCHSNVSHMGKRNEWFTYRKKLLCANCYLKKVPPKCDKCHITEEELIMTYGTVNWYENKAKDPQKNKPIWVFPNSGGVLCKQCSAKKWYLKKNVRCKLVF